MADEANTGTPVIPVISIPQNRNEANKLLMELITHRTAMERITNVANGKIAKILEAATEKSEEHEVYLEPLVNAIYEYAETHKDDLFVDNAKSADFPNGIVGWHPGKESVKTTPNDKAAITALRKKKLFRRFVRITESIRRDEILKKENRQFVAGMPEITVVRGEDEFYIKPTRLEVVVTKLPGAKPKWESLKKKPTKKEAEEE